MAVVTPIPHQSLPAYPSSGEEIWVPGSSTYPFITVHAAHHTGCQPSLSYYTSRSNTGSSDNVSRTLSIKSPPTPFPILTDIDDTISILDSKDKPLPPTPSAAIFGGEISAEDSDEDSDHLLAGFSGDDNGDEDNNNDDVQVSSELPSKEMIEQAADIPILDADGNQRPFKSLYISSNPFEKKRVMVIFVRHFFCGNCQEYLRSLISSIPSPSALPQGTSLAIIGCGSSTLIPMYMRETACPYPIYTDPSKRLYSILGMVRTLSLGHKDPEYIHHSLMAGMMKSVVQGVKRLGEGDAFRGGDMKQIGGEFVFETTGGGCDSSHNERNNNNNTADVKVTWCHRMKNTRDHAEVQVIRRMLGLDAQIGGEEELRSQLSDNNKKLPRGPLRRWTTSFAQAATSYTHRHRWSRLRGMSVDAGLARLSFRKSSTTDYCGGDC
ncbi:hypothetical protein VTN00DRAFT_9304 [Thermoascus crustaceus]|uniref:uncharacterized protein n=1 Tax=Thermoascus crustaceus TaxID=5088 RepID=UPI003743737E